jgi:phage-related protein
MGRSFFAYFFRKGAEHMADSDFGLKIGIEGEREFKAGLRDINQQFKVLGSEMKLVESQFNKQDRSVSALTSRNEVLTRQITEQKEKIELLRKALENSAESFGENDQRTKQWTVQLNNAQAQLNNMERELKDNEKAIDGVGDEFQSAEKKADGFGDEVKEAAKKADDANDRFRKLGDTLKTIGRALAIGLVAIGTAAIAAGTALVGMTVDAAAYADEMLTQSSITGMSVEKLQAYSYAADLVDVSLETMTGSMAKNIKSMSNASQGSAKFAEAYDKLGVSVTNADGTLRDSETVYWEAIDALKGVANETERDALAMQLFGKSAQDLNPLIEQGSEGIAALTEEAKRMGAVLSEESIAKLGQFDDSVQRLKQGSLAAKRVMGTVLLPQLQTLADSGVSLLGQFTSGLVDAGGDFNKISQVIGDTVGGAVNALMQGLPQFIQVGMQIITSIGSALIDNMDIIVDGAKTICTSLLNGLIDALPDLTEGALDLVLALTRGILDNLPRLVEAAVIMIASLTKGIGDALPELIPAIVKAVILIVTTLLENIDQVIEAGMSILLGLIEGIINALPVLIEAMPQLIVAIVECLIENLPQILFAGVRVIGALIQGIVGAVPQLSSNMPRVVSSIVSGVSRAISSVVEIGKNIVSGLWQGIQSMGQWIQDKIGSLFRSVINGAKKVLGIHSPSTVFAGIGENMGLGLGGGFTDAMRSVEEDMKRAIPTKFDGLNIDVGAVAKSPTASKGSNVVADAGNVENKYEIVINNPKPEAASDSVRTTLLKHSYGLA